MTTEPRNTYGQTLSEATALVRECIRRHGLHSYVRNGDVPAFVWQHGPNPEHVLEMTFEFMTNIHTAAGVNSVTYVPALAEWVQAIHERASRGH